MRVWAPTPKRCREHATLRIAAGLTVLWLGACTADSHHAADDVEGGSPLASDAHVDAQQDALPPKTPSPADAALSGDAGSAVSPDAAQDASQPVVVDPVAEAMHARADEALEALMLSYWPQLSANTNTYDWMYAHYWDAVLDAAERRGPSAFAGTARMFYELQAKRGWLDNFYDDENWITLALLHAYSVTGEAMYLTQAKFVFADIMKAWDTTCCGKHPGGLWWQKPTMNKVTAINGGAVVSASRLYAATQDDTYLDFAKKVYDYWSTNMVDASTGHVYDGIDNSGSINTSWNFTYNEGIFIGGIVELSRVTHDDSRMPLAHKVAGYMLAKESASTSLGTILSDGKCSGDGDMFKGIGARYLGELYAADPSHTEYRDFLQRSADAAWNLARDAATDHISCDWAGPFAADNANVGSLGSAAVAIAAAAKALGTGEQRAALTYEAEEADLHAVGIEAKYAGFSGWGYVAGFGSDKQSVDFLVQAPAAGDYRAEFRFGSTADAKRSLTIGASTSTLTFPSTGGYDKYQTLQTSVTLAQGANVLTVAFDAAKGSTSYLNLDRVVLTKP